LTRPGVSPPGHQLATCSSAGSSRGWLAERPDSRFSPLLTRMNLLSRKFFPRVRVAQSCEASRPLVLIGPPGGAYSPGNEAPRLGRMRSLRRARVGRVSGPERSTRRAARHGQEAGRQRLVDPGDDGQAQVIPEVAALTAARLMGAEAACDELVATARSGGAGGLALEHQRTDGLLSRVVGRRHIRIGQEGPQRRLQLEQLGAVVGRARALVSNAVKMKHPPSSTPASKGRSAATSLKS